MIYWIIFGIVIFGFIVIGVIFSIIDKDRKSLKTTQINYQKKEIDSFLNVKNLYLATINNKDSKTWKQIENTKNMRGLEKSSGIYLIYIKNDNVNESIPVYVGQAKDIFKRWKQHQNQFRKIIRGEVNTRTYKKIVHYLNLYNLKLEDLNFTVVKKCSIENLNDWEKYYIDLYKSDVYGFNNTKGGS